MLVVGVIRAVLVDFGGDGIRDLVADAVARIEFDAHTDQQDREDDNDDEGDGGPAAAGQLSLGGSRCGHGFIVPGVGASAPLCGGDGLPRHGEEAILQFAPLAVNRPPVYTEHFFGATPAVEGAERGVTGGGGPSVVGSLEEVIDFLPRNIAVDERFGESLCHIGGGGDGVGGPGEGEADRTLLVEQHPGGSLPHLIARTFHDHAAGGEAGLHDPPRITHFFFGVLTEHIEGAYQLRAVVREFKAALFEADAVLGGEDAARVDFEAHNLELGCDVGAEAGGHFYGGPGGGAVAKVDSERVRGAVEGDANGGVVAHPAVAFAEAVDASSAPGDGAQGVVGWGAGNGCGNSGNPCVGCSHTREPTGIHLVSGYPGGMNSDHTTLPGQHSELTSGEAAAPVLVPTPSAPLSDVALTGLWEAARAVDAEVSTQVRLADYTTSQLGAPARGLVTCQTAAQVSAVVQAALRGNVPLFVVGGGSNLIVGDESTGVQCHEVVMLRQTAGVGDHLQVVRESESSVTVQVPAGLNWDVCVAETVARGWGGVECLSGIPGQVGATPVQNVGAYGVEMESVLQRVQLVDRVTGEVRWETADQLDLAYRYSNLKFTHRAVVTAVELRLRRDGLSAPIRYRELARRLGCQTMERVPVQQARETVLALRRGKGMVVCGSGVRANGFGEPAASGVWMETAAGTLVPDPDTFSTGSFFTNPVISESMFADVLEQVSAAGIDTDVMPKFPGQGGVKLSAAWLIDQAGFSKGFPGVGHPASLSTRHTLALTNRGSASTAELLEVARQVRDGVWERFGVELVPEPILVGCSIPPLD